VQRKFLGTLFNTYSFYILYAEIDKFEDVYDDYFTGRESGLLKAIQIIRNANGVGYLTPGGAIVPAGNARLKKC
jgi:hypothetical protein